MEQNSAGQTSAALKLEYAISSDPFPLLTGDEGGARLKIMLTNNNGAPLKLTGLIMKFPLGNLATDLTKNENFTPGLPDGWKQGKKEVAGGFVKYSFSSVSGNPWTFPDKTAIIFFFNDVKVNDVAGTTTIEVTEVTESCKPANNDCPVARLAISKFPQTWGQVSFDANPPVIKSLVDKTELSWKGPVGATYTITYTVPGQGKITLPETGKLPFANEGKYPAVGSPDLKLADTTTFTLDVLSNIGGTIYKAQNQKTVTTITEAPKIMQFSGSLRRTATGGMQVVLNWITTGVTTHISGDSRTLGQNSLGDEYVIDITPQNPLRSSYTLKANNSMGDNEATLNVTWANDLSKSLNLSVRGLLLSPDGKKLFPVCIESDKIKLFIYDAVTLTKIPGSTELELSFPQGVMIRGIAISRDGTSLYVLAMDAKTGAVQLKKITVNGNTLSVASTTNMEHDHYDIIVSPDGTKLYMMIIGKGVKAYNTSDLSLANSFDLKDIRSMSLNKNGSLLYLLTSNDSKSGLMQISTSTFTVTIGLQEVNKGFEVISSPDDKMLCVINKEAGCFSLYKLNEGGRKPAFIPILEKKIEDWYSINQFLFAPDSEYLFLFAFRSEKCFLNIFDTWSLTNATTSINRIGSTVIPSLLHLMRLNADGTRLYGFVDSDSNIHSFKPVSLTGGVTLGGSLNSGTNDGTA